MLRRLLLCCLLGALVLPATAQRFSYETERSRPVQALAVGYTAVTFEYDGAGTASPSFAYDGPAFGVVYTRPGMLASVAYGTQAPPADDPTDVRDLRLLDAALTLYGDALPLWRGPALRLTVPLAVHSGYRSVARDGDETSLTDAFNITTLGLGGGLALRAQPGERLALAARVTPLWGLALRGAADATGSARLLDADVSLDVGPLWGRLGLALGYGFRTQTWDVGTSDLLPDEPDDLFDYRGHQHSVRLGLHW